MKVYSFSGEEAKDIVISLAVLSLIFSYPSVLSNYNIFLISLFVLGIAFIGHELAHKFAARKLGFFAEYRMWKEGLLLAAIFAFVTNGQLIFAAPGAVYFSGRWLVRPKRKDIGKIGLAGPLVNIIFLIIFSLTPTSIIPFARFAAMINAWLAIFNLIPFSPLDGEKVFNWDRRIWLVAVLIPVTGFVLLL